jgi:hypothetical protein
VLVYVDNNHISSHTKPIKWDMLSTRRALGIASAKLLVERIRGGGAFGARSPWVLTRRGGKIRGKKLFSFFGFWLFFGSEIGGGAAKGKMKQTCRKKRGW